MTVTQVAGASFESRRAEIDRQAASLVVNSSAFQSLIHLPPIPPSPDRPRLVEERNAKLNEMVRAAAEGREERFHEIARDLGIGREAAASLYSDPAVKRHYLYERQGILASECVNAATPEAQRYWMGQLMHNTVEQSHLNGTPIGKDAVEALNAVTKLIPERGGQRYAARVESLLASAMEAGFPIRAVFRTAQDTGTINNQSSQYPYPSVESHLRDLANKLIRGQIEECGRLYAQKDTSPTAQMEFNRAYNRLLRMCDKLLPPEAVRERDFATKEDMDRLFALYQNSITNLYGLGSMYP